MRALRTPGIIATTVTVAVTAAIPWTALAGPPQTPSADTEQQSATGKHQGPWIVAHRGSPRTAPEETAPSYRNAIREGADVLEADVQLTKDDQLVLVHDDSVARTTDAQERFAEREPWNVGDFTLEELTSLDAGTWFSPRFAGESIMTVDELLDLRARERVGLTLELKSPQNSPGVAEKLAETLRTAGLDDDSRTRRGAYEIMVHSRDQAALREFEEVLPDVPLVYLTGGEMLDDAELDELAEWTIGVFADPRLTTAADVKRATDRGLEVYADPVDSPSQLRMAYDQGYAWVLTNQPETARIARDRPSHSIRPHAVVVDHVLENPAGDDVQPEKSEHVVLRNTTDRPLDISGYTLRDQAGTNLLRTADDAVIQPGSLYYVHVGPGTTTETSFHNGYTTGFLNNTRGDTVTLYDAKHRIVDTFSYIVPAE